MSHVTVRRKAKSTGDSTSAVDWTKSSPTKRRASLAMPDGTTRNIDINANESGIDGIVNFRGMSPEDYQSILNNIVALLLYVHTNTII